MIRDPVHGDIELTPEEARIVDTGVMQRLRGIKQLGTAYLVYPGCVHTRFDHSLGTLAAAARMIEALRKKGHPITADDTRLIRMAALLHDVTHIPFGHTFEDERNVFPRHDTPERIQHFLSADDLGELLESMGVRQAVIDMLSRPHDWRGQVVSGTLDADLLDYLRRDSYFSGLSQRYDDRVFAYFSIEGDQLAVDLTKGGLERHDARSEIIHLLRMRYVLTERVYFHHTKVTAGAMISKALELATAHGLVEQDLYALGDAEFFQFLSSFGDPKIDRLVRGVERRELYKRAYMLNYDTLAPHEQERLIASYHRSVAERRGLEEAIAAEAGVPFEEVVVYAPARTTLKEASMAARFPDGVKPLDAQPGRYLDLDALRQQHARLWKFWIFAPRERIKAVGQAAERLLEAPNQLAHSNCS